MYHVPNHFPAQHNLDSDTIFSMSHVSAAATAQSPPAVLPPAAALIAPLAPPTISTPSTADMNNLTTARLIALLDKVITKLSAPTSAMMAAPTPTMIAAPTPAMIVAAPTPAPAPTRTASLELSSPVWVMLILVLVLSVFMVAGFIVLARMSKSMKRRLRAQGRK
jgi:hypothetical protein